MKVNFERGFSEVIRSFKKEVLRRGAGMSGHGFHDDWGWDSKNNVLSRDCLSCKAIATESAVIPKPMQTRSNG
jgi:hypothetical protein